MMKIALIQLGRIGDLVLATVAIQLIKRIFPEAKIYFIVSSSNYFVLENNPNIEKILIFNKNPFKLMKFIFDLKGLNFDYYIDIKDHFSNESHIIARLAKAKIKIGFNDKKHNVFDIGIQSSADNANLHFVERVRTVIKNIFVMNNFVPKNFDFITKITQKIDIEQLNLRPQIYIDSNSSEFVNDFLHSNNISNFILINISAGSDTRIWTANKWIKLLNLIQNKPIIIFSAPQNSATVTKIASQTNVFCFPPTQKLMKISALIAMADLLISPDTSVVHIAAAFDIPVIMLTNKIPLNIVKFAPLSTKNEIVTPPTEVATVRDIEVSDVLEAYKNISKKL